MRTHKQIQAIKWMLAFLVWLVAFSMWSAGWMDNSLPHDMTGDYLCIMLVLLLIIGMVQAKG